MFCALERRFLILGGEVDTVGGERGLVMYISWTVDPIVMILIVLVIGERLVVGGVTRWFHPLLHVLLENKNLKRPIMNDFTYLNFTRHSHGVHQHIHVALLWLSHASWTP